VLPDRPFRRDLCQSAKEGHLCIDDLCHTGGETLCGFDLFDYQDMLDLDEEKSADFDCMDCGMCDNCIARTRAFFEEMEENET
jgi:hypothetical protein